MPSGIVSSLRKDKLFSQFKGCEVVGITSGLTVGEGVMVGAVNVGGTNPGLPFSPGSGWRFRKQPLNMNKKDQCRCD